MSASHHSSEFAADLDGVHGYHWKSPACESWACVLFCPGQGDFASRYEQILAPWIEGGIEVFSFDWPGHGMSRGRRGHVGSLASSRKLMDRLFDQVLRWAGPRAVGVSGHSMGGLMAMDLLARRPEAKFGWISSPLLRPSHGQSPWLVRSGQVLGRLLPGVTIDTGVRIEDCIRCEADEAADSKLEEFKDGQGHSRVSLGWGLSLMKVSAELSHQREQIGRGRSLFVSQGTADQVCPPKYCREFFELMNREEVEFRELEGALHEPFSDEQSRRKVDEFLGLALDHWRSKFGNFQQSKNRA